MSLSPILNCLSRRKAAVRDGRQVVVCRSTPKKKKGGNDGKYDKTETRATWIMVVLVVSSSQEWAGTSGLTPTGLTEAEAEASKSPVVGV
jgi:hypothetical protein